MAKDEANREAEKKIEEALKSGAKVLDLSEMKITELPESLGQLTQLQTLNLSRNYLTVLPESFGRLTQLQSLNLYKNQLTNVPEALGHFTQLELLDLSNNRVTSLLESLGNLSHLRSLKLAGNKLTTLPESLSSLKELRLFWLGGNKLSTIPDWIIKLQSLEDFAIGGNGLSNLPSSIGFLINIHTLWLGWVDGNSPFKELPECIRPLTHLSELGASNCILESIPKWLVELTELRSLSFKENFLSDLPPSIAQLEHLENLDLDDNPLNPELAEAYKQGVDGVKAYLRAKAAAQIKLNEAKLILVGEGEVGKSCLMDALLNNPWQTHDSTHGIEIKQIKVTDSYTKTEITLNGWDFGGQRVYRPTHQLFFSAPAVYLVVWKPRQGPQQGFVREWIQLVKRREPTAKILVVATHGGPKQRQPDIDRQEFWDVFGKETIVDFFHVESKPDKKGNRRGIKELKKAVARIAVSLPEVGRSVPKNWQDAREALKKIKKTYLPFDEVIKVCRKHKMDVEQANLFITIEHRLGHLIYYQHDSILSDIVVLKPDWLATAISFVLDDEETRTNKGLVRFSRLGQLWSDPKRSKVNRYPATLHKIFIRLMERFDLCYRVMGISSNEEDPAYLIAQLVPDVRPENLLTAWSSTLFSGDIQQTQICRIVDAQNGQSANAEGLFYQLIVRLHRYTLGRTDYNDSVHWQRGLILEDEYKSRAFLEHIGNNVRITVRAPYPESLLGMLTREVKYLVESFWEGLHCEVMVPCVMPCGRNEPGIGLFEVDKLIDSKRKARPEFPCPVCNEWQNIDTLLRNAPAAQPDVTALIFTEFAEVKAEIEIARQQLSKKMSYQGDKIMGRFDRLDSRTRRTLSRVDKTYTDLLQILTDEAKEGPRLFSFVPVDRSKFNPREWTRAKFRLTLWCEHSRQPLTSPELNGPDSRKGIYDIELTREWFQKAGPYLKLLTGTLSLVLPVSLSGIKLRLDDDAYKAIEEELGYNKSIVDAAIGEGAKVGEFFGPAGATKLEQGEIIRAEGATLRELHALLKAKDPGFGGLVRVLNKRQEFLWVHEKFAGEY